MAMADFLSPEYATYTTIELDVAPQTTMTEESVKNQTVHEGDDGTIVVTTLSSQPYFTVTLQWNMINTDDSDKIFNLWNDPLKANGLGNTFYWQHPTDGETYTVRFMSNATKGYTAGLISDRSISQLKLRVTGVKP